MNSRTYLGKGWSFPPSFDNHLNSVKMVSEEEDIKESLQILLTTKLGERVMLPEYGCNLDEFLFEGLTITVKTYITDLIKTSVLYFEARINLHSVDISESNNLEGIMMIRLEYTVKTTNSRFNYVFPYYQNERSLL